MAINRTAFNALVDDDGSNTTGTAWNKAAIQSVLLDPADAAFPDRPSILVSSVTGTVAALPIPAGTGDLVVFLLGTCTIQGIAPGLNGQRVTLIALGGQVDLLHQSLGATDSSRLINMATSGPTSLAAATDSYLHGGVAVYRYDVNTSGRWRLVSHDQGAWIRAPYAASNFVAGAMTWTVEAGDISELAYILRGRTVTVAFQLQTTSIGGALGNTLSIANTAWGTFVAARGVTTAIGYLNVVSSVPGYLEVAAAGSTIGITKQDTAAFVAVTNAGYFRGQITFPVQ